MTLTLQPGKYYVRRDGVKSSGPCERRGADNDGAYDGPYSFFVPFPETEPRTCFYTIKGHYDYYDRCEYDIAEEYYPIKPEYEDAIRAIERIPDRERASALAYINVKFGGV